MASEKSQHGYRFSCDACGEVYKPPRLGMGSSDRDYTACWESAKDKGWRCFKNPRGDWVHKCMDCRGR